MAMTQVRRRLTVEDWAAAALEALGEGGLTAVAVEPLAIRLGATKGSFYWHFANREALVGAALELWEQRSTEAIISALEAEPDPVARLRMLFMLTSERAGRNPIEINIRAAAAHHLVAPALRRVMQRRIEYTIGLFEQIGFSRTESVRRGMLACAAYVGHSELMLRLPGVLPIEGGGGLSRYVESVIDLLLRGRPNELKETPDERDA
jgi:AcrR family transcriptional regulator